MDPLLLPIVLPAAAALVALLLPRRSPAHAAVHGVFGALGSLGTLVTAASLSDARRAVSWPVADLGGLNVDLALRVDGFSGWTTAFVGLLGLLTAAYGTGWFRGRGGAPGRFQALVLLAVTGGATVLLADNLLLLLVGWELVTLALFLLVIGGRPEGAEGAAKAYTLLGVGDLALLVGIVLVGVANLGGGYGEPWSLATLRAHPIGSGGGAEVLAWLLLFVAAAAKAGAMPLHTWIPSMSTGTSAAVMAFLPGSLDKVLGIYLAARLSLHWGVPTDGLRWVMMALGAVTILGAVFMAMVQHDLRRLLSYHAVSQVGYMLLGLGTGTVVGAVGGIYHMLNHAVYKACLFLAAGSVEREAGTTELSRLGGLGRAMPLTFGATLVAALAISGIPPLNGFVSKWLVYQGCVVAGVPILLVAALFGSALTLASFVKVLHSVFFGAPPSGMDGVREGSGGIGMPIALVVLAGLCVLLGVFAPAVADDLLGPVVGLERDGPTPGSAVLSGGPVAQARVGSPLPTASVPAGVLAPLRLTGLLLLGFFAALLVAFLGHVRSRRVRPVFVGGQRLDRDRNRFPGTEFYRTVQDLPVLGGALRTGERGTLDPYELVQRVGKPLIRALRALHGGRVGTYLVWSLVGLVVLLAALLWR